MKTHKSSKVVTLAEQIANVLAVRNRLAGRYVVQVQEHGTWKRALSVNPLMSDGGLQPPGPPLFGTPTFQSRSQAEEVIAQRIGHWKPAPLNPAYASPQQWRLEQQRKSGKWGIAWNFAARYGKQEPFEVFDSKDEAERAVAAWNAENSEPPRLRAVPAEEDVMLTTLSSNTEAEEALYGKFPKVGSLLNKFPLLANAGEPSKDSQVVPNWVNALADDEAVDVVLDADKDGVSEDCFVTTAGELKAASFGELSFERSHFGVTVYADSREQFVRLVSQVG